MILRELILAKSVLVYLSKSPGFRQSVGKRKGWSICSLCAGGFDPQHFLTERLEKVNRPGGRASWLISLRVCLSPGESPLVKGFFFFNATREEKSALLSYINRREGAEGGLGKPWGLSRAHGPLSPGLTQGEHLEAAVFWPH